MNINKALVSQRIWNIVVNEDSARYLAKRIREVLTESQNQSIFNEMRLLPADETELSEIARDLDVITVHVESIRDRISNIAMKYRENGSCNPSSNPLQ